MSHPDFTTRAKRAALLVRQAFPLRYVSVKPYTDMPSLVYMRRGRGAWVLYSVIEALGQKRMWRMETMRKRKRKPKEKRHV